MKQIADGFVKWDGGASGDRLIDDWTPMKGSLTFMGLDEFVQFAETAAAMLPWTDCAPANFIAGLEVMIKKLLAKKILLDLGGKIVADTFALWTTEKSDPALIALIQTAADEAGISDYATFKQYVGGAVSQLRRYYSMADLAMTMREYC